MSHVDFLFFNLSEAPAPAPAPPPPPPPSPPPPPPPLAQPEVVQPPRPIIQYIDREPSMSSLKVRAEKEKELAEAENYWKERIHKLEHEV